MEKVKENETKKEREVAIIGAGLVGSLHAILMAKKGYKVEVFERRSDIREAAIVEGKSINLALSDRGWKALELAGIGEEIKEIAIPMYKRCMHALDGTLTYQPYGVNNEAIYSVSRGGLNKRLVNLASEFPNISYNFNTGCKDIDLRNKNLVLQDSNNKEITTKSYEHVFATDGAFSAARLRLQKTPMFNYEQIYLSHGYKELVIPANEDGSHKLDKNCLHIWPREEFMMIALANLDGSFTCTLFFPVEGKLSFETIKTQEDLDKLFEEYFMDAIPLMPTLHSDYLDHPTSYLVTVKCAPWNYKNEILLMGDSAHAIVPFYGQGMNSGFEDCTLFHEMYTERNGDWDGLFEAFSDKRIPDANAIAELALYNYIEMRDKTADEDFLVRKKIENKFTKLHPDLWLPLYSQVTFSHIPYNKALENGLRQRAIMDKVMELPNILKEWNEDWVMLKVQEFL